MDLATTIALVTALVQLAVKYAPDIQALGEEIIVLIQGDITPEALAKIQAFTDEINARAAKAEDDRLNLPPSDTGD